MKYLRIAAPILSLLDDSKLHIWTLGLRSDCRGQTIYQKYDLSVQFGLKIVAISQFLISQWRPDDPTQADWDVWEGSLHGDMESVEGLACTIHHCTVVIPRLVCGGHNV